MKRCQAPGCTAEANGGGRVCEEHWKALPGRWRARLSIRCSGSTIVDDQWKRAIAALTRDVA